MGTTVSPNSATTFLNYFSMLGKHGIPDELVTFERQGYRKGLSPWKWDGNTKPLCAVEITDGNIDDCAAGVHVDFANAFIGGGVMTGDVAQEELLFLVKPELMVAMALENRVVDEEAICVSGARKYSLTEGYGQSFKFVGDYDNRRPGHPAKVCALDGIRGGGPAMTEPALLRDMNKARIAFDGFPLTGTKEIASGHWGCGAFGNNHDLMFLKQWLAASEAGAQKLWYHDFDRNQSHHIFPLIRRLRHLTVGELWHFLQELTSDLRQPHNMAGFCARVADIAVGSIKVPPAGFDTSAPAMARIQQPNKPLDGGNYPAAEPATKRSSADDPAVVFTLAELKAGPITGVDTSKKEIYLSTTDFEAVFGMPRVQFFGLPKWKRDAAKLKSGLF
jgi:hypothetical protein